MPKPTKKQPKAKKQVKVKDLPARNVSAVKGGLQEATQMESRKFAR